MDDFDESPASDGRKMSSGERDTLRLEERRAAASSDRSEQDAEARMRQALSQFGQRSAPAENFGDRRSPAVSHGHTTARRHRFVQDGEVPVSMVRPRRDAAVTTGTSPRLTDARDRALDEQAAERAAREQLERKLTEAQTTIRTLQTRLGHAELERDEALETVRALREQLAAERAAIEEKGAEEKMSEEKRGEKESAIRRPRNLPETASADPEPVKWWL